MLSLMAVAEHVRSWPGGTGGFKTAGNYAPTFMPQAEAATTSALAAYRTGGVDFMTVVDNRMNVNRYRRELLALEATEGRAWAELEMLVGRPLLPPTAVPAARTAAAPAAATAGARTTGGTL